ncbi:putative periplasmic binding protein-like I [Rosa chinensis]|uniref:Glutamate receptor n=2 Tax=Rosa chinensis TaxID=74649 RepID=A0A2P6SDW3_ROSCH|nr:glutamate receptor 1.4 isoform X1 [Rosa chinensis]PRQ56866.1 putative periplasmic binding protein-like I [Rosa chinensis]
MEFQELRQTVILAFVTFCCLIGHLCADIEKTNSDTSPVVVEDQVHVGVILDMGSREGKIILSCISMALSDFYHLHDNYSTRVVLHSKDSKGEPLPALSAALGLLENIKVESIIGAQTRAEANLLAELGEAAKLPVMSLSRPLTDNKYPFLVEIMRSDQAAEVRGISALIEVFKWRDVIILYDNKEYEKDFIPSLVNSFQEITHRSVSYKSSNIASSSSNEEIIEELQKLTRLKIKVFVVHVSHLLAPRLFLIANKLGMMSEGYAWIVTSSSMNLLQAMNLSVIESMQGVLGFKSSIPASINLHSLTTRLRRKFYMEDPNMEAIRELSADGIWAYDATWALAEAVERARLKNSTTRSSKDGAVLLNEMLQTRFKGLSGEIQYVNGKLIPSEPFGIVNVIGKGEIKRIGFWPCKEEVKSRKGSPYQQLIHSRRNLASTIDLERVIWPGGSKRELSSSETIKLRIGVPVRFGFKELVRVEHDLETNTTHVTGFSIDVFKAAIGALPYEVQYEFIPFEDANGNSAGTYNDLVYQVYLKKFDAVVGDVTITENRSQYVDFTIPYTDLGVGMLVPNAKENMWIFFKPLSKYLWITTAAFFILTGFVVWIIEHPTNENFRGTAAEQIGTVFWFTFSSLGFTYTEKLSNNLAKFVVIIWVFLVLILSSTYTATLASMMTVKQIQLNSRGNYIGYQSGSLGVIVNLNFKGIKPYRSSEEYFVALSKGSKHNGVSGVIDEVPYINIFLANYSADYSMIKTKSITNGFAFVFPKGSKLVQDVSRKIERLRQEEKLIEMEKTWFLRKTTLMSDEDINNKDPNTIDLYDIRGLFVISGASLAIALFLFIVVSHRFRNLIRGLVQLIGRQLQRLRMFVSNKVCSRTEQNCCMSLPMQLYIYTVR